MTVLVEVQGMASREGLQEIMAKRLQSDLGLKVRVDLVGDGELAAMANIGREGKPKRLLDRRFSGAH